MTQEDALSILKTGESVFLTGEPGSGKTHTINKFVAWLREHSVEPAVTASTGIAATHIGGFTIHSWSGIGIKGKIGKHDIAKIAENKRLSRRIRDAKVLIIDEISMLSAGTFGMVEEVCRGVRGGGEPFGGMQVILVGDFFQLPPIARRPVAGDYQDELFSIDEDSSAFAFNSQVWRELNPIVCYLSEQHRQEDGDFLDLLSAIRRNSVEEEHLALLKTRVTEFFKGGVTKLFSHNANVDYINEQELAKLPGEAKVFNMKASGPKELVKHLIRGCLSPEILSLKIGAKVMFTRNDLENKYVNGTMGVIEGFSGENNFPLVRISSGRLVEAERENWVIEENGKDLARLIQIPLRLAWAITIHKSQGMSLDSAYMDLSSTFEYGQGYVALSRVRTFSGLTLRGFNSRALEVHPEVQAKDAEFRNLSQINEARLMSVSFEDREERERRFVAACGGKMKSADDDSLGDGEDLGDESDSAGEKKKHRSLEKIREKHPNAYKPWGEAEDLDLVQKYTSEEDIPMLSEAFGRQPGSIRARLIKLGLIEDAY